MKNIRSYTPEKYKSSDYEEVDTGIYKYRDRFVTSLSFQQEYGLGEGVNADSISQYPLEDLLDQFSVYVSDFYKELNTTKSTTCYLEFSGFDFVNVQKLRQIIGKHVYNRKIHEHNTDYIKLIIE